MIKKDWNSKYRNSMIDEDDKSNDSTEKVPKKVKDFKDYPEPYESCFVKLLIL